MDQGTASECVVADSGGSRSGIVGVPVTLGAAESFVVKGVEFSWLQITTEAPPIVFDDPFIPRPSFVPPAVGTYRFELTVTAPCMSSRDEVLVTVTEAKHIPGEAQAEVIAADLELPLAVVQPPDESNRLFIVEQRGKILMVKRGGMRGQPYLDVDPDPGQPVLWDCFECGLLGMVFDPDFAENGFFYLSFTGSVQPDEDPAQFAAQNVTRLLAYQVEPNADFADPQNRALLLSVEQPFRNHHGGHMAFGKDGKFYMALGDGSSCGDPESRAQDPGLLLGKVIRLEVAGLAAPTVPIDNPFLDQPTYRPEIWALGLRNPWRWSFDRLTGDMYLADVGQRTYEEVNFSSVASSGGENYGWRIREGFHCYMPVSSCGPQPDCTQGNLIDPIYEYAHGEGFCSIIGGYVYRGAKIPQLKGFYLFADYCAGQTFLLRFEAGSWQRRPLTIRVGSKILSEPITSFGEGADGEIYICTPTRVLQLTHLSLN